MMDGLTIEKRRHLVMAAIEHARACDRNFREVEANASASAAQREEARLWRDKSVAEFGWQWKNVEAILKGGE